MTKNNQNKPQISIFQPLGENYGKKKVPGYFYSAVYRELHPALAKLA